MRFKFEHNEPATVPWEKGHLIVLEVVDVGTYAGGGLEYTVESRDTFPADIKERHAEQLRQANEEHAATARQLLLEREAHAAEMVTMARRHNLNLDQVLPRRISVD